jgi:hypothetical protein
MRRLWIATLVVGALVIAACSASVLELDVGTCFNDPADLTEVQTSDIASVDCDTPHSNEVFANVVVSGDDFPGIDVITGQAESQCVAAFGPYIGEPYETSMYDILWFGPSEETWDIGDRVIICAAYDLSGEPLVGSIAGIGQ